MNSGMVACARMEAAAAGISILRAGGNAADAAIATAFALSVTDPANCGIGAYGGYAVVATGGDPVSQIAFNTTPPRSLDTRQLFDAPRKGPFVYGGPAVTVPAVVPGLWELSQHFGRLPWAALLEPAIDLARDGFPPGPDLIRAALWTRQFNEDAGLRSLIATLDEDGAILRQPALAGTLVALAELGIDAMIEGPIPDCLSRTVGALGGFLSIADFKDARADVMPARSFRFAGAIVHGAEEECSGFGVCRQACGELGSLPANWADRDTTRIGEIAAALGKAWTSRDGATRGLVAPAGTAQHTTHLCTADDAGGMVSLTFTHGPLWFGAGVLDPETGILLNCGANLLVTSRASPDRVFAQANICPIIVADPDGTCAFGSPGGRRIPGLTATFLVDLLMRRFDAGLAIANPRISVANDGALEVERPLDAVMPSARVIERDQFYGPASAIVRKPDGTLLGARDPRFEGALARIGG